MKEDTFVSEVLGEETVLTPSDLYNREFKRAITGGYQPREVDEYLERVADVLETLIRQVRELKEEREESRGKLRKYRDSESALQEALVSSQEIGRNIVEAGKREANALIEEARLEKERQHLEAARIPPALKDEIAQLEVQRNRLRSEMLAILASHRALLDSLVPAEDTLKGRKPPRDVPPVETQP